MVARLNALGTQAWVAWLWVLLIGPFTLIHRTIGSQLPMEPVLRDLDFVWVCVCLWLLAMRSDEQRAHNKAVDEYNAKVEKDNIEPSPEDCITAFEAGIKDFILAKGVEDLAPRTFGDENDEVEASYTDGWEFAKKMHLCQAPASLPDPQVEGMSRESEED